MEAEWIPVKEAAKLPEISKIIPKERFEQAKEDGWR